MRYNRASIDDALRVAVATGARYVYATYGGYVVTDIAPPSVQAHYEIVNGHPVLRRSLVEGEPSHG